MPEKEIKVMKVGSGKIFKDGVKTKIRGYAPRAGKSLAELLKENHEVKIIAMGDSPTNNMVKAIAHAQVLLKEEERDLVANDFGFESVELSGFNGEKVLGKSVFVIAKLV